MSMEEEEELGQYLRVKIPQLLVGLALGLNEVYLFSPKYTIVSILELVTKLSSFNISKVLYLNYKGIAKLFSLEMEDLSICSINSIVVSIT